MDYQAIATRRIFYPLYLMLRRDETLSLLKSFEKSQFYSKSDIIEFQWQQLRRLLEHAYNNSAFYREKFKGIGAIPSDFTNIRDFLKFPILEKEEIRRDWRSILVKNSDQKSLIEDYTGGSTGQPLKFYYNKHRNDRREASRIRHNRWTGWDIGEKVGILWGDVRDREAYNGLLGSLKSLPRRLIYRNTVLDAFDMDERRMFAFASRLEEYRPSLIQSYTNAIYLFAQFLKKTSHKIRPKGIVCTAETLTEEKRKIVQDAFRCKMLNRYGCREVGLIASECEFQRGLHVNAENVYIEVIRNGDHAQSGEIGEVIVTDLFNYTMPFIRYRIGDTARLSQEDCECGRGLPLLKNIEGRTSDFIVTPKGRIIHGEYFTHLFYGVNGVSRFQLIQEDMQDFRLILRRTAAYDQGEIDAILSKIRSVLKKDAPDLKIRLSFDEPLDTGPSGKHRFTISKVPVSLL